MYRTHAALLATVFTLCGLEFLQAGMVAFASVPIRGGIEASPEEYSLVAALYACIAVMAIAQQRWLIERLGWRKYTLGSIAVFIAGAALCGLSGQLWMFALGRAVMALGGGAFMPVSRTMVTLLPAGAGRFTGVKVFAAGLAGGTAAAPLLAALAVTHNTWRALFGFLIIGAALAGLLSLRFLPDTPYAEDLRSRTSAARVLLLAAGSFFLLYMLQRSYYDFYSDTHIVLAFVILASIAVYLYFHVEHEHPRPLLLVRRLRTPRYMYGVALFSFCYLIVGANSYMLPMYLQSGLGYAWETIGRFQALGLASSLLTWVVMARVLPKHPSPKKFFVLGFLALAGFAWQLSSLSPSAEMWWHILPALALNGCFVMLVLATAAMQTFADVGGEDTLFSHAQQVKTMLGQLTMAMGTALATVFLQWRSTVQYGALNVRLNADDPVFTHHLAELTQFFSLSNEASQSSRMALAQIGQQISQQATLVAATEYFWAMAWIALFAMIFSASQRVFR